MFGTDTEEKLNTVMGKNPDLKVLRDNLASFLFAPITSCEVERVFSAMKAKEVIPQTFLRKISKNCCFYV